jgi:TetR/AcrR family transcriptional regulator
MTRLATRRGRKRPEGEETAQRILQAAEEHFAAEGLAGARTDRIALAARANKALLYYYFGDKKRLHRAVLENLLRQFRQRVIESSSKSRSARERLITVVSAYFDFLATHPNYPRLVQREVLQPGGRFFDGMAREFFRPLHDLIAGTIEEGMCARELRAVDARQVAYIIMGMTTSYFAAAQIMSRLSGQNMLTPRHLAERKSALLDFIDHGLARSGGNSR